MASEEQELEDEHCEAERVMIGRAVNIGQALRLELGRGIGIDTHRAAVDPVTGRKLHAVAVDQADLAVPPDPHRAMIDIADNDTGGVRRRERDGGIGGDPDEEAPVAAGQVARPVARAVDFVDVERLAGPVHDEPVDPAVLAAQQRARPGGMDRQRSGAGADHRLELGRRLASKRLAVDLGDLPRTGDKRVDGPLPAFADLLAERRPSLERHDCAHRLWPRLPQRAAPAGAARPGSATCHHPYAH